MDHTEIENGVHLEVLGTCMTNTTPNSQHTATVQYKHLWSFAQEAALIAVCEKSPKDACYYLIDDPERRAKRIAANYADLYFKSSDKSKGNLQFYWVALAAFVVKDIVEAYRFAREEVLQREWKDVASAFRNSSLADIGSLMSSGSSPYQHVMRTYAALAKGNLWLFMDIYPWLWFFMEYGINRDGSLNKTRLDACLGERNLATFQIQSKTAVEELPFGPEWLGRLSGRLSADPVYKKAGSYFDTPPSWSQDGGYGQYTAATQLAHSYCKAHVKEYDNGYRTPASPYWGKFKEAYFVMESEHIELSRVAKDSAAIAEIVKARQFKVTGEIRQAYAKIIEEHSTSDKNEKFNNQKKELAIIAQHEQVNVLQPLIYNDPELKKTMDMNHEFSRLTGGWLSPQFKVIYSFAPKTNDPNLQTIFDAPDGLKDRFTGAKKSLPNKDDRMEFVAQIAKDFNRLMSKYRPYMEDELRKIQGWLNA